MNLLLNVLGKRSDGFHELETVMHPLKMHDELAFERAGNGVHLSCNDPALPTDERNLVSRAAAAFFAATGIAEGVRIELVKNIPVAAGLGGGSGNAGTTLLALNELFDEPADQQTLNKLAASLGSDVPFFLQSGPALAQGRGERLVPLAPFAAMRGHAFLIVYPGFGISTAWAYQQLAHVPAGLQGIPGRAEKLIEALQGEDLSGATAHFFNSLELVALPKYPLLALFQEFFRERKVLGTLMSGSGSSTFALVKNVAEGHRLELDFKRTFGENCWTRVVLV